MMNSIEQEVLKDLPGYKAILKAVLKSQIQNLVEQLSQEAEEETVLLSVSTSDGTLSHLGSLHGKDFLQDKDNIKFQFLTHCLKKKHSATPVNKLLDSSLPNESHSSTREDNSRQNGNILAGQVAQSKQTLNQIWQHSNDNIPLTSKDNDIVNSIDNTFQKNQDEFPDINAEFSETLTVNGEKLVVQTNTGRRKRKRKPSYIPSTQRIKASEPDANVKVEDVEDCSDVMEPSALNISDPVSSQIDDNYVSIKAEPVNDTLEDIAAMSSNQSLIENMTDGGFQHDVPLMRAGQQDFPLLRPDNIPVSPGGSPAVTGSHQCTECGMVYSCASGLHYHMKIHNRNLQVCNRCGYKCVRKTQLLAHVFKHHDPTGAPFCYICQKMFTRTDKLTEHNRRFHRGPVDNAWKQIVTTTADLNQP